jgi:hypothetical protein
MLLQINVDGYDNLEVQDCPVPLEFADSQEKPDAMVVKIDMKGAMTTDYYNDIMTIFPHKYVEGQDAIIISKFVRIPEQLNIEKLLQVRRILGFIPFYSRADGNKYYNPVLDFTTTEEFSARKKPVIMDTFLGVSLPQAFINDIRFTESLISAFTDGLCCRIVVDGVEAPTVSAVVRALNKISQSTPDTFTTGKRHNVSLSIEDAKVFKFLGLSYLIKLPCYIANNQITAEMSLNARIEYGDLDPEIWYFKIDFTGADWSTIPDVVIRLSDEYEKIRNAYDNGNDIAELYATKLFIQDNRL